MLFQPSLPARGATERVRKILCGEGISTLAPREGSDFGVTMTTYSKSYFNPRSPRGERPGSIPLRPTESVFQPSLPARGATFVSRVVGGQIVPFQPSLPARGATIRPNCSQAIRVISTLAPREGSDAVSFAPVR